MHGHCKRGECAAQRRWRPDEALRPDAKELQVPTGLHTGVSHADACTVLNLPSLGAGRVTGCVVRGAWCEPGSSLLQRRFPQAREGVCVMRAPTGKTRGHRCERVRT